MNLIEDVPAAEIFCSGLAEVHMIGDGCAELTMFRNGRAPDGGLQRYLVFKIIMPVGGICAAVELLQKVVTSESGMVTIDLVQIGVH